MADFIDLKHSGVNGSIAAYVGDDWLVDPGPESTSATLLAGLPEGFEAKRILLTHIHFDHAGATGRLLERWPDAEVWVHEVGAPHMIDPSRLVGSARRLYGEDFDRLWGAVVPIPEERVRVVTGGEEIDGWRVEYTPGHARHHVTYLDTRDGTAYAGDVAGVRIGGGPALPPTPPPDIDVETWLSSIETVRGLGASALAITHFGVFSDVDAQLDEVGELLVRLAGLAREFEGDEFGARVMDIVAERSPDDATMASYATANPPSTLWGGLNRYWTKRDEAAAG